MDHRFAFGRSRPSECGVSSGFHSQAAIGQVGLLGRMIAYLVQEFCEWRGRRSSLARQRASSRIIVAPFSAIIAVGVLVLPDVIVGMIDASTTRRPPMP